MGSGGVGWRDGEKRQTNVIEITMKNFEKEYSNLKKKKKEI